MSRAGDTDAPRGGGLGKDAKPAVRPNLRQQVDRVLEGLVVEELEERGSACPFELIGASDTMSESPVSRKASFVCKVPEVTILPRPVIVNSSIHIRYFDGM